MLMDRVHNRRAMLLSGFAEVPVITRISVKIHIPAADLALQKQDGTKRSILTERRQQISRRYLARTNLPEPQSPFLTVVQSV